MLKLCPTELVIIQSKTKRNTIVKQGDSNKIND